jgi:hypothetical protein
VSVEVSVEATRTIVALEEEEEEEEEGRLCITARALPLTISPSSVAVGRVLLVPVDKAVESAMGSSSAA